jgi:hypothetical protein
VLSEGSLVDSNTWWIGPIALLALRLLYAEARFARAQVNGQEIVFRPTAGLRLIVWIGIVGLAAAVAMSEEAEESWVYGLAVGLLVLFCFGLPSTITLGRDIIRQEAWWGRRTSIGWASVGALEKRSGGEFHVFGREGQAITFSRYHVDPVRFVREVLQRANLPGVVDASEPPTMRR